MYSDVFNTRKGRHEWPQNTICEMHRTIYDLLVLGRHDEILPHLEKAYLMGIKMTKKLVDYKMDCPECEPTPSENKRLRNLRNDLQDEISRCV